MVRGRWVLLVTLVLLQAFTISAALYVWSGGLTASGERPQAAAPSPSRAPIPLLTSAPVLSTEAGGAPPEKKTLAARLSGPLSAAALGGNVGAVVIDAASGATLFSSRSTTGLTPASTTKVVTAVAALTSLGPDARLSTRVVQGAAADAIILVGGGDPTLAGPKSADRGYPRPASLVTLASRTAKALKAAGVTKVTLAYDDSLFSAPHTAQGWKPNYVPEGTVAPVTALMHDVGRVAPRVRERWPQPSRATAVAFASLLRRQGVTVAPSVRTAHAAGSAKEIARVESPPIYQLVERMLTYSDNDLAEALAHQVAVKEGLRGTFADGARATTRILRELGVDKGVRVFDGSGLSTGNRITPQALARLLALAASPEHPELHTVISGLPVAHFTGTLDDRYDGKGSADGAGLVRAKTGTLNGVNTLAGIARTANGHLVTFAFMADRVPAPDPAVAALDRLAAIVSAS
ncbi:D-alanyl-D-alanine carboxypeptidase/D-alanyl-D-alanine-endopeptidase [Thermopolyspora sp. NPDC052614]|uniref:D-alanyl-D-alanine carboxypeptidase/D-alanyl-D-alanine endopeptidase n=1 Tax=Thermopolyspora sp. NPDC052614 TaxID=3155682 RepID=UPI00341420EA